jgi:hypothetical protein
MINAEKQNLVSIWMPPASYPQFYGMFSYAINDKNGQHCKLKKFFFYRHSLNRRFF